MSRTQDDRKQDRKPPRLPHERDEAADSQAADNPQAQRTGAIAHEDLEQGRQDTSKAQEADAAYHRLRQDADAAPQDPRNRRGRAN